MTRMMGGNAPSGGGTLRRRGLVSLVDSKGFTHLCSESKPARESLIQFLEQPNRLDSGIHFNSAQFRGPKRALGIFNEHIQFFLVSGYINC
jgi:hypothetical protein